ncbi:MAG: M20/M25/M40 family metallo-hydrolase [Halomonas sp.]|nr:M20/M25/M40 family metallo-hydrolase [Halomonas sp.]TVP49256.1 MAG: M20/M25/M40 family metallo-hydrolase [Halomonas sp.]
MKTHPIDKLESNFDSAVMRLKEFLSIESISTDVNKINDCVAAADWVCKELDSIGFSSKKVTEGGLPAVISHGPIVKNAPRILFYGHYDVQPADDLDAWLLPPFEADIIYRNEVKIIHGRGSADDKGQLLTFIEACRALYESTGIPVNITFLIEGEEEIGSPSISNVINRYKDELESDIVFISDTSMIEDNTPTLGCQLRGFLGEIVTITGPSHDLHSGNYGGAVHNPAGLLVQAISKIYDTDGLINLRNFYKDIEDVPFEILKDWIKLDKFSDNFLKSVGLSTSSGEKNRHIVEKIWSRPCMEINSICSGYQNEGFKTIIPSTATAKVSFRLVGEQDPEYIRASFRNHVREHIPGDCKVEFESYGAIKAVKMDCFRPEFVLAQKILREVWGRKCVFAGMGGSIPAVSHFKQHLNLDSMLLGFSRSDDNIHSANEKLDYECFTKGALSWLMILQEMRVNSSIEYEI